MRIAQGSNNEAKYVNPFSDLIAIGEGFRSGGNRRVVVIERSLRTRAAEAHVTVPSPGRD